VDKPDNRFTFTQAKVEGLPPAPPRKRPYYWDDGQPRLCLRVTDKGAKSFYYLHRHAHGQDFIKLGSFPAMTVETARKAARKTAAQLDLGANPAEAKRQLRGEPTFRELFDHYAEHLKAEGKRVEDIRAAFERYLGAMPDAPAKARGRKREKPPEGVNWEGRKASKVTADDLKALHKAIGKAGKTTTANRIVEIVSAVYNVAQRDKLIGDMNPAKGIEPYSEAKRDRHLTSDESARFIEALKAEPLDWQDFFMMLLLTGQRLMNVAGMRWRDVDLQAGTWALSATQTKQKAPVVVPLTDQAIAILTRRREAAGKAAVHVFPADSKTGHVSRPQKRWKALVERAGLDDLRKHDLRHTAASWLAQRGASLAVIGAALGHRDIQSTMRYAHMVIDPVRQAMQAAHDGAIGAKAEKPTVTAKLIRFKRRAAR